MDLKKFMTPKAQRVVEDAAIAAQTEAAQLSAEVARQEAAHADKPEVLTPISSQGAQVQTIDNFSFDNLDFSVFPAALYAMQNMKKLSSNEVDVAVDPLALFEAAKRMYPADQVTFNPYLATFREGSCAAATSTAKLIFAGVQGQYGSLPIVGVVIRAHTSDLFKGSTRLHVKTPFIDVTSSLDDLNSQGVFSFLFAKGRDNVTISAAADSEDASIIKTTVEYAERDKTCFVTFPDAVADDEVLIEADNLWLEIFPIVGSSMIRKLVLQDITTQNFKILPNQLMKLI